MARGVEQHKPKPDPCVKGLGIVEGDVRQALLDPVQQQPRLVERAGVQDQHEFGDIEPDGRIAFAHHVRHRPCQRLDHPVAVLVSMPVVHLFEVDDVGEADRRRDEGSPDTVHFLLKQHQAGLAVDQPGLLVERGVVAQVLLGLLDLVDAGQAQHVHPPSPERRAARCRERLDGPVFRAHQQDFVLKKVVAGNQLFEKILVRDVAGVKQVDERQRDERIGRHAEQLFGLPVAAHDLERVRVDEQQRRRARGKQPLKIAFPLS